jgi:hypothetical protein
VFAAFAKFLSFIVVRSFNHQILVQEDDKSALGDDVGTAGQRIYHHLLSSSQLKFWCEYKV